MDSCYYPFISRRFSEEDVSSRLAGLRPEIVIARPFGRIDTIEEPIDLRERFRTWLDVQRPRSREEDNICLVSNIMDYFEYISDDSDPINFQEFLLKNGLLDLWETQILWDDEELMSGRSGLRFRPRIYRLRWYVCLFLLFCGHGSIALPVHDTRQLRRRRLNAPRHREDNSQCSESREGNGNRVLISMALVGFLIGKSIFFRVVPKLVGILTLMFSLYRQLALERTFFRCFAYWAFWIWFGPRVS